MNELIEKMQKLMLDGIQPSLCLLGTKQLTDIKKDCLYQHPVALNDPDVKYFYIAGNKMKIIRSPAEDLCEVYGNDKFVI